MNATIARSHVELSPRKGPQLLEGIISAIAYTTGIIDIVKDNNRITINNELDRDALEIKEQILIGLININHLMIYL